MNNPNAASVIQDRLVANLSTYYSCAPGDSSSSVPGSSSGGGNPVSATKGIATRKVANGGKTLSAFSLDTLRAKATAAKAKSVPALEQ